MNRLIIGVMAVTGCVLLAGASVAETTEVPREEKRVSTKLALPERKSREFSSRSWLMERRAKPHMVKEDAKELLRGKRPK